MAIQVTTTGTTSAAHVGIYADNGNMYPSSLVVDGGTVLTTTTGMKTFNTSVTLQPGLYWLVHNSNGTVAQIRAFTNPAGFTPILGLDNVLTAQWGIGWQVAHTFTVPYSLPATFPGGGLVINSTAVAAGTAIPVVTVRISG